MSDFTQKRYYFHRRRIMLAFRFIQRGEASEAIETKFPLWSKNGLIPFRSETIYAHDVLVWRSSLSEEPKRVKRGCVPRTGTQKLMSSKACHMETSILLHCIRLLPLLKMRNRRSNRSNTLHCQLCMVRFPTYPAAFDQCACAYGHWTKWAKRVRIFQNIGRIRRIKRNLRLFG